MTDRLLTVALEAHHPGRNHHRWYELAVGVDLFGLYTLTVRYGRVGQNGQSRRYSAADPGPLRAVTRSHLLRRLTAPRRLGCPYRLVAASAAGLDPVEWLPADVLTRFGGADGITR